jgi:hypothetical protein
MREFLAGAAFVASLTIAYLFLRHWRRDREPLFMAFGLAFAVLAIHYLLLPIFLPHAEDRPGVYALRLVAFGLIIAGVAAKNRE